MSLNSLERVLFTDCNAYNKNCRSYEMNRNCGSLFIMIDTCDIYRVLSVNYMRMDYFIDI